MGIIQRWFNTSPGPDWKFLTDKKQRKYWFHWDDDWIPAIELWHFGRPVGYVNLIWEPSVCELADIFLEPRFRRRGLGAALIREVFDHVRAKGLQSIIGYINPGQDGESFPCLIGWYWKQGFMVQGQHISRDLTKWPLG